MCDDVDNALINLDECHIAHVIYGYDGFDVLVVDDAIDFVYIDDVDADDATSDINADQKDVVCEILDVEV